MAVGSDIRAGAAYVELYVKDSAFARSMKRASKRLSNFGRATRSIGGGLVKAGAPFAIFSALAIKSAADAEESWNRFSSVFGSQTQEVSDYADQLAADVGRSSSELLDSLSSFQGMFRGLGFGNGQAAAMSKEITALALDFASFNNLADDDAIGRFISALSGSAEVLDRYGINTKQAALQQEILKMGLNKSWSAVTEQEKALARLNIISRTMGDQGAVGDAVKTAGSFTNQLKRTRAELKDITNAIGKALIPKATSVVTMVNKGLKIVRKFTSANRGIIASVIGLGTAIGVLGAGIVSIGISAGVASFALGGLATIAGVAGSAIGIAGAALAAILSPIGLVSAGVIGLAAVILTRTSMVSDSIAYLKTLFGDLSPIVKNTFGGIVDALKGGDLKLAAEIGVTGIHLAWLTLTKDIRTLWGEVEDFILKSVNRIVTSVQTGTAKAAGLLIGDVGFLLSSPLLRGIGTAIESTVPSFQQKGATRNALIDARRVSKEEKLSEKMGELTEKLSELKREAEDLKEEERRTRAGGRVPGALDGTAGSTSATRTAAGVFNARAAVGLAGSGSVEKKIEQNTALQVEQTREMIRILRLLNASGGGLRLG